MTFFKAGLISTLIILCAACSTTPPPSYQSPVSSDNAKVSFESDFELHTHFFVNAGITPQSCGKFERAGYLLKRDSILLYDKPIREIKIEVPSDRIVGIGASHYFDDPTYRASCYPQSVFFKPEAKDTYIIKVNLVNSASEGRLPVSGQCFISVTNLKADGSLTNVKTETKSPCSKN